MASTKLIPIVGRYPKRCIPKKKLQSRELGYGYHRTSGFAFHPGDTEFKMEDFMVYGVPEEEPEEVSSDDNNSEVGAYITLSGRPHPLSLGRSRNNPYRRPEFKKKYLPISYNFYDYLYTRSIGMSHIQPQKVNLEFGTRHMLVTGMFKEHPISLNRVNKVFCSQWIDSSRIIFGTRCNKILLYDSSTLEISNIDMLANSTQSRSTDCNTGVHTMRKNPSGNLLATGGLDSRDLAIYSLPDLEPVTVCEKAHTDWILASTWIDDEYVVSAATDGNIALWRVTSTPFIKPVKVQKCFAGDKIRGLEYNRQREELIALTMNSYVHVFDPYSLKQTMSKKLPNSMDNACLTQRSDGSLYAVGSKSHLTLLDPRTLNHVKKVTTRVAGCSFRSVSFNNDILTIGTGIGVIMLYDLRANRYLESTINSGRTVMLKTIRGWINPDDAYYDVLRNLEHTPAIYTHCYDDSGTRLFAAGGPLDVNLKGNYGALWM